MTERPILFSAAAKLRARIADLEAEVARLQTAEVVLPTAGRLLEDAHVHTIMLHHCEPHDWDLSGGRDVYRQGRGPTLLAAYNALREQQKGGEHE